MKRILVVMLLSVSFLVGSHSVDGFAQEPEEPAISISLAMVDATPGDNTMSFLLPADPSEPLEMVLSFENTGPSPIIVPSTFSKEDFHLSFTFVDPDGKGIVADGLDQEGANTPPFARVISINGEPYQVEQVEILPAGWTLVVEIPDAHAFYTLEQAGWYSVKALISLRTYPAADIITYGGADYAKIEAANWQKGLESNTVHFALVDDGDNDGFSYPLAFAPPYFAEPDCDDNNPLVYPGAIEVTGNSIDDDCDPATSDAVVSETGTILINAYKHYVGGGSHPGSSKEPLEIPVKLFDKSAGSCVARLVSEGGLPGFSWKSYPTFWWSTCVPLDDGMSYGGTTSLTIPAGEGDYLIVGMHDENNTSFSGDEIYIGVGAEGVLPGETVVKHLKIIEKVDGKKVPAKYKRKTGSELLIIEPEYIEWDGTQELYPFVFESVGEWDIVTSVEPPEGFISDFEQLNDVVNTDTAALQFIITDIGSTWVATSVEHEITHNGKKEKVKSTVDIKCSKKLAKKKGFDRYCNDKKDKKDKKK